jgi:AcrR family transcriptional regulator
MTEGVKIVTTEDNVPRAFNEQEKEGIRKQLHEQGRLLFERYGLKKTSVDELARAAGISKGAFYLFYDSKEELFMEIVEQFERDVRDRLLEFTLTPAHDSQKKIVALLKSLLLSLDKYPLLKSFNLEDYQYLARKLPPERIEQHARADRAFAGYLMTKIKSEGISARANPRLVSNLLKSLFFVGLHRHELGVGESEETLGVLIELVARYMVEGK